MKITAIKTFLVDAHRANFIFVKIYTDAGYDGLGEATTEWSERAVVAAIEEAGEFLIGKDPFATDYLISTMHAHSYWRTGAILRSALAGMEAALLDLKGKALGVPVYELLGGKHRDTVGCYGNGWFSGAITAADFAKKATEAVAMGFRALKWDPFGNAYLEMDRAARNRTIENVEAVRAAVGPDIDLMIEVHGRLNVPTAIAMARALAKFDPRWLEEPVPPESIDALADVRAGSPIPIATGERYCEPERFMELIAKRAVDILQPDIIHVGGMLEGQKIAAMAHARFLPVAPHNPTGPVANAMTLQVAATIPNFCILETIAVDVPWRKEIVRESLNFTNNEITIPTTPGLGLELDEAACARHPYVRHPMPQFDKIRPTPPQVTLPRGRHRLLPRRRRRRLGLCLRHHGFRLQNHGHLPRCRHPGRAGPAQHRRRPRPGRQHHRSRRPRPLHPARRHRLPGLLARPAPLVRRRAPRRHHARGRPCRPPHENRNRGHRPPPHHLICPPPPTRAKCPHASGKSRPWTRLNCCWAAPPPPASPNPPRAPTNST
jgi:galactonate dehydratase